MVGLRHPPVVWLWTPSVFMRFMPAVETSGDGSQNAVVAGIVPHDASDQSAFDAPLGVGRLLGQPSKQ